MVPSDSAASPPSAPSADQDYGDQVRLTVAGVAARLGVAAPTLRTWDRRYGLGPSDHVAGSHRRYGAADLARLETMRRLTLDGVAPADAARIARDDQRPDPDPVAHAVPQPQEPSVADPLTLAAAAVEGDHERLARLVQRSNSDHGIIESWVTVIRPALEMVSQRAHPDRPGLDPRRALQAEMMRAVSVVATDPQAPKGDTVVYASDEHQVAAHVLAAELSTRGVRARVVHPGLLDDGPGALLDLVAKRPGTLTVFVEEPEGGVDWVQELCDRGDEVFLVAFTDEIAPRRGLHRARTLGGAVHEIMSVL